MKPLKPGDIVGIVSPSHVADRAEYQAYVRGLEELGLRVKLGENLYRDTWGYVASARERSADFNAMVRDESVKMVFFGGGQGAVDLLPHIDYQAVRRAPKYFLSYSDGTSILDALYAQTGLVTYYGQTPALYGGVSEYDRAQFAAHFFQGGPAAHAESGPWHTLVPGRCEGCLLGGYLVNFALSLGSPYCPFPRDRRYILFLEESERFHCVPDAGIFLTYIEQHPLMEQVTGLLFGHYADQVSPALFDLLRRFGERRHIPVACCDDFGHGACHAVLPIGREARLDTQAKTLCYV